jgi:hypothetical protein
MTNLKTIDTDFSAAMMSRGARLDGWEKSSDNRKLYWKLRDIDPKWMDDYRQGVDGITRFVSARRMLINVAKTEIRKEISNDQNKDHSERRP